MLCACEISKQRTTVRRSHTLSVDRTIKLFGYMAACLSASTTAPTASSTEDTIAATDLRIAVLVQVPGLTNTREHR
eukprot:COSAG01_NODE_32863_length_574_cov_0.722105_1_plen_76_part_00